MTVAVHSLGLLSDGTTADFLIPSGDAVMISVIDEAGELLGSCAVITVLQDEEQGTPIWDPSCGVVPTRVGRLVHD